MPVCITINGDTASHALAELGGFATGLMGTTAPAGVVSVQPVEGSGVAETGPIGTGGVETTEAPARRTRKSKTEVAATTQPEPAQAIQTGGDREPAPELVKEPAPQPKVLTLDDVRSAANPYVQKFKIENAKTDLQFALEDAVGNGITAISQLADASQEDLQKAINAFVAAGAADARYVSKRQGAL